MGVVPNFSQADLERHFAQKLQQRVDATVQTLRFVGERFVANVRSKAIAEDPSSYRDLVRSMPKSGTIKTPITEGTPRFKDRTSALASSVGYQIMDQGKIIHSHFPGSGDGKAAGEAAAVEMAKLHPSGTVLIVVAGMQYAAAVESLGYDVLTGSSFIADRELREALKPITGK